MNDTKHEFLLMNECDACESCDGEGTNICTACDGLGIDSITASICDLCDGDGFFECPQCGGLGTCIDDVDEDDES